MLFATAARALRACPVPPPRLRARVQLRAARAGRLDPVASEIRLETRICAPHVRAPHPVRARRPGPAGAAKTGARERWAAGMRGASPGVSRRFSESFQNQDRDPGGSCRRARAFAATPPSRTGGGGRGVEPATPAGPPEPCPSHRQPASRVGRSSCVGTGQLASLGLLGSLASQHWASSTVERRERVSTAVPRRPPRVEG